MTDISKKITTVPNICGIQISFTGTIIPSTIDGYQVFNNSIPLNADFQAAYGSKTSFSFAEESDIANGGIFYKQKFTWRFPAADSLRADRIVQLQKTKYVKIMLTDGRHLVLGRNDHEQNARPVITIKSTDKISQVEVETQSISPTGYIPNPDAFGLPTLIPIDLIND